MDEDILPLFAEVADDERTTPEVATQLGISKPATWKRFSGLYERGLLEKHPGCGLRSDAWSLSEEGQALRERGAEES